MSVARSFRKASSGMHSPDAARAVFAEGRLEIHYQPVIDAARGRVAFVEALARFPDGSGGYLANAEIIPALARGAGLPELGKRVLRGALMQVSAWKKEGLPVRVSVNIPAHQASEPAFLWWLFDELEVNGLMPDDLMLEIADIGSVAAASEAAAGIRRLALAGFRLALDRFGKDSPNLWCVSDMNVRLIKTDRLFGKQLSDEPGRQALEAMHGHCRALQLEIAVVGVEQAEAKAFLRDRGIKLMQGFHFARPMDGEVFRAWMEDVRAAGGRYSPPAHESCAPGDAS